MKLVLVHGWACHSGVWDRLLPLLGDFDVYMIDLGFMRGGPRASNEMPSDALCVGHSFGVLWLLKHGPRPMRGLVSIAGFDCLHRYVPEDVLAAMRQGMIDDPKGQLKLFWENCGLDEDPPEGEPDTGGLRAGLDWIARWDESETLADLRVPVLALAAENDRIVRKEATEAIWGKGVADLHWHKTGGHMLQLSEPDWCAGHIKRFADGLKS